MIASIDSDVHLEAVTRQVCRILSLDHPGHDWLALRSRRGSVVLKPRPSETRIAREHGRTFTLAG